MSPTLEENIQQMVAQYTGMLVKALKSGELGSEAHHAVLGALHYLIDPSDLIPDDVPNIGLLDDLYVLLAAGGHLLDIGFNLGISPAEHQSNEAGIENKKGLLYGSVPDVSIQALALTGKRVQEKEAEIIRSIESDSFL